MADSPRKAIGTRYAIQVLFVCSGLICVATATRRRAAGRSSRRRQACVSANAIARPRLERRHEDHRDRRSTSRRCRSRTRGCGCAISRPATSNRKAPRTRTASSSSPSLDPGTYVVEMVTGRRLRRGVEQRRIARALSRPCQTRVAAARPLGFRDRSAVVLRSERRRLSWHERPTDHDGARRSSSPSNRTSRPRTRASPSRRSSRLIDVD